MAGRLIREAQGVKCQGPALIPQVLAPEFPALGVSCSLDMDNRVLLLSVFGSADKLPPIRFGQSCLMPSLLSAAYVSACRDSSPADLYVFSTGPLLTRLLTMGQILCFKPPPRWAASGRVSPLLPPPSSLLPPCSLRPSASHLNQNSPVMLAHTLFLCRSGSAANKCRPSTCLVPTFIWPYEIGDTDTDCRSAQMGHLRIHGSLPCYITGAVPVLTSLCCALMEQQVVSVSLISLSGCVMAGCALMDLGEKETWVSHKSHAHTPVPCPALAHDPAVMSVYPHPLRFCLISFALMEPYRSGCTDFSTTRLTVSHHDGYCLTDSWPADLNRDLITRLSQQRQDEAVGKDQTWGVL
ncbi:unnamed protein product [Leuciscus chuanchicus]